MRLFLRELTTCDTVVSFDYAFWELRVLKCPEAKETRLKKPVIGAVDVILTVADSDQVGVLHVDIN